jgi:CO/xanthine dehydrogenase FAD-binding subunit
MEVRLDLNTISAIRALRTRDELSAWKPGSSWLGGGTWLFSEPQPHLDTLLDLTSLGWEPLTVSENGLRIAATCTIAQLNAFTPPPEYRAGHLIEACCRSLLGSFKVWNVATVGGNICLTLPAAPMISLTAALDGIAVIWTPDGGERQMPMLDFVLGAQKTALKPGEILRAVDLPRHALKRQGVHRQVSLTTLGRSAALLIGTRDRDAFDLTVSASTKRPVRIAFPVPPTREALTDAITAAIPFDLYHDDLHGRPDWRRHLTYLLAEEIRAELFEGAPA